ncbi:sensor histidine kinase [Paenibacillus paeoniae]|uniref:histidine kinase n=1 Tax=Paenibacillus paeoniae TaxID=2292705 RepID=A0A371P773_9BACL|nr:HAMP domain-containing sensor histidine kinase [Paenibacillus paeoniae]REK71370.1 sensor histidine kinase [Paenibacillus paeoniae]
MLWLFFGLAVLFAILYVRELARNRVTRRNLRYIQFKLDEIANRPSSSSVERVQVMTEQVELREMLRAVNEWLDRARQLASDYAMTEQAMRRMLSNVSHDLKTPLTVILGYAEMLDRSPELVPEERQRLLGQIYRKTQEVLALMNAFFDLAKLEANDSELEMAVLDIGELARHRILAYYDLLASEGYEVDINIREEPLQVYANEEALTRILDNLFSNAVRYGSIGKYLGVSIKRRSGQVVIEVADRGPGIPPSEQKRIFERLYTLEDSRNKNVQGSGLGLAITKRLIERIGGSIAVQSVPDVRTSFTVTLRAMEPQAAAKAGSKE